MQAPIVKWWQYPLTLLYFISFTIIVIAIVPFVFINDVLFGKYKGWNYNYKIFKLTFQIVNGLTSIRNRRIYEAPHDTNKQYVFVANHISYFDIPEMLIHVKQPVRVLGKKGPDKIPIFGYYYRKGAVMVDRSSDESRAKSLIRLRDYLNNGISILICPEGTFNMTDKPLIPFFDGAFRLAIETQTNIKPLLILDTFKTLHYSSVIVNNGVSRLVYLEEVSVQGLTITDLPKLKKEVYDLMEQGLLKYKAAWIATSS